MNFGELFPIATNIVIPLLGGAVFFALARYVSHIAPMRTLVTGQLTYQGASWGFACFGLYLATRPLQILLGPHPFPLLINNLREFCLMGFFAPAVLIAMLSLCLGSDRVTHVVIYSLFALCFSIAVAFVGLNVFAIGGSEVIFHIGGYPAHDGLWFKNPSVQGHQLMNILFVLRVIDPVLLLCVAGGVVLWHAYHYPAEKRAIYDNMPKKLYLLAAAVLSFALSMGAVGVLALWWHLPNQWWVYYVGALVSGILESLSLSLPVKHAVHISDHLTT
ncbi:MAG: hypothetical protein HYZ73_01435 [Elusimicrobia bacterium]|nr:hypothetical protein [Elusimicrobiota bacterium]